MADHQHVVLKTSRYNDWTEMAYEHLTFEGMMVATTEFTEVYFSTQCHNHIFDRN